MCIYVLNSLIHICTSKVDTYTHIECQLIPNGRNIPCVHTNITNKHTYTHTILYVTVYWHQSPGASTRSWNGRNIQGLWDYGRASVRLFRADLPGKNIYEYALWRHVYRFFSICPYAYTHTHTHTYIYIPGTHFCICIRVLNGFVCMSIMQRMNLCNIYIDAHIHTQIHTHEYIHSLFTCMYGYIHKYTQTHVDTYLPMHIHVYIYRAKKDLYTYQNWILHALKMWKKHLRWELISLNIWI